jgi:hypothetical protein
MNYSQLAHGTTPFYTWASWRGRVGPWASRSVGELTLYLYNNKIRLPWCHWPSLSCRSVTFVHCSLWWLKKNIKTLSTRLLYTGYIFTGIWNHKKIRVMGTLRKSQLNQTSSTKLLIQSERRGNAPSVQYMSIAYIKPIWNLL